MHRIDNPVTSVQMECTKRPQISIISQIQKDKRFVLWHLKRVGKKICLNGEQWFLPSGTSRGLGIKECWVMETKVR